MTEKEKFDLYYQKGYLHHVKIMYSNGRHKYANLFKVKQYELGKRIGSIVGYRNMNLFERFLFRNCL